jgi:hypothetical protein
VLSHERRFLIGHILRLRFVMVVTRPCPRM